MTMQIYKTAMYVCIFNIGEKRTKIRYLIRSEFEGTINMLTKLFQIMEHLFFYTNNRVTDLSLDMESRFNLIKLFKWPRIYSSNKERITYQIG